MNRSMLCWEMNWLQVKGLQWMGLHLAGSCHWWCSPASVPGPVLLNIFISDLNAGVDCICTNFIDTEVEGAANSLGGWAILQRDRDILEHWATINSMRFITGECWVLHLGWVMSDAGTDWSPVTKSSSAEGTCRHCDSSSAQVAVCLGSQGANCILGSIKHSTASCSEELIILLYFVVVWLHLEYCVRF